MEIILIRHGKPESAHNRILNASEYALWIREYNASMVAENSRPEIIEKSFQSYYLLSSDYKRALHSANIYTGKGPEEVSSLFREMDIPRYKIPLKLKAWNWVYFSRFLWMIGFKGSFESFIEAKQRAEIAADELIDKANSHQGVVLFGHGFMNRYIRKSLIKKGWTLNSKNNAYWGVTTLQRIPI